MNKNWGDNRMKKFYSEMWRNTVGKACKNFEGLFMFEGSIETFECVQVSIWCMLDWIWSQNCRNILLLHTVDQLVRNAKNETLCVYPTRDQTQDVLPRVIV